MDYKLAKELKDAGFKQPDREGYYVFHGTYILPDRTNPNVSAYAPTFSELIEACGDEFKPYLNVDVMSASGMLTQNLFLLGTMKQKSLEE